MRTLVFLCALCACMPTFALPSETSSLLSGYVPGQSNSFLLRLPQVSNLGSYNIELLLTSPTGIAGTDFYFDAVASAPAANGYVFASSDNFFASANVLATNTHSLTLSDFSVTGVNIVDGVNDNVATIFFGTSATFNGILALSLADETFQLDMPSTIPTPVTEFEMARNTVSDAVDITVPPVPEPTASLLFTFGFLLTCSCKFNGNRRRSTRVQPSSYL